METSKRHKSGCTSDLCASRSKKTTRRFQGDRRHTKEVSGVKSCPRASARCFPIYGERTILSGQSSTRASLLECDYYLREISETTHKSVDGTHPSGGVGASRVALTLEGSERGSESARRMIPVDRPAGACYSFARHFHSGAAALLPARSLARCLCLMSPSVYRSLPFGCPNRFIAARAA